jgi:hypothetical protein
MNRSEFNKIRDRFNENIKRLKSLKIGQNIYVQELADPFGSHYFRHEVVEVDLNECCVVTIDHSTRPPKPDKLYSFNLPEEVNLK